jgi:hypothetical protein
MVINKLVVINMMKTVQILVLLLTIVACNEERVNMKNESQQKEDVKPLQFSDIIPDNISDSAKSNKLNEMVKNIEFDTTLTKKNFSDSSDLKITGYFKNDALVKIMMGVFFDNSFGTIPNVTSYDLNTYYYNFKTYYFFMDKFICLKYECNNYQNTGLCNPVSARSMFYFYFDSVIGQNHNVNIDYPYDACGCQDLSHYEKNNKMNELEVATIKEVERLEKVINYN